MEMVLVFDPLCVFFLNSYFPLLDMAGFDNKHHFSPFRTLSTNKIRPLIP
jgi:hypothetical protein